MAIEEILVFRNGSEYYGISTVDIDQISKIPLLVDVVLKPYGVKGMCPVNGGISVVVDLNLVLKLPPIDIESPTAKLLNLYGQYKDTSFLVADIQDTITVNEEHIEYVNIADDPIMAVYKEDGFLIQVISVETVLALVKDISIEVKEISHGKSRVKQLVLDEEDKYLIFKISHERFALSIEYIREIVLADMEYTEVSGSDKGVLGLVNLRNELIIVNDFASYYELQQNKSVKNRILIITYQNKKIGLLVDEIVNIKSFARNQIEYFGENFEDKMISGAIHESNSLLSILDDKVLDFILMKNKPFLNSVSKAQDVYLDEYVQEVIVFKIDDKEYSFETDKVFEIIEYQESIKIAFVDDAVDGFINVRGQIVPVISIRKKLNLENKLNVNSKIIICKVNKNYLGFVVSSVCDIFGVKKSEMKEEHGSFFQYVLHLDNGKRLVLGIDLDKITKIGN